jgi:hypothetical protein
MDWKLLIKAFKEFGEVGILIGFCWWIIDKVIRHNKEREKILYTIVREDLKTMNEASAFQRKEHEALINTSAKMVELLTKIDAKCSGGTHA